MNHFVYEHDTLHAEGVALPQIAERFGTPTYVYSRATIARHVAVLQQGLQQLDHLLCYAIKANGNLALLELLHHLGCGFDAVSGGELARVQRVGAALERTIVSGVGKSDAEIVAALRAPVRYICVESLEELESVARLATQEGVRAAVSVRVNPDVDAKTHPYIATGLKENKFGIPITEAPAIFARGLAMASLRMVGVTCHIGSQITSMEPFFDAAQRMRQLAEKLLALGIPLTHLGMGGGLGVPYGTGEQPPPPQEYGTALTEILRPLGLTIVLEPGRVIVGNAGILLTRVIRTKAGADRHFVVLDAGMNDLLRPALYNAYHDIEPVVLRRGAPQAVDVVGPVCESADTFAKNRSLPPLAAGDLVAIRTAGAYGFAMSSTYNGRPRAAEVLCDGAHATLIRHRETFADLWRGETRLDGSAYE